MWTIMKKLQKRVWYVRGHRSADGKAYYTLFFIFSIPCFFHPPRLPLYPLGMYDMLKKRDAKVARALFEIRTLSKSVSENVWWLPAQFFFFFFSFLAPISSLFFFFFFTFFVCGGGKCAYFSTLVKKSVFQK